jgi:hypothetical protein
MPSAVEIGYARPNDWGLGGRHLEHERRWFDGSTTVIVARRRPIPRR